MLRFAYFGTAKPITQILLMFSEYSINGYWFVLFLTLMIVFHLGLEIFLHRKRLFRIKHRIHVNGTRGKSSVARLIAAGMRGGRVRTVCKTTGTMARYIDNEGKEEPIIRIGRTNVIEQIKVVRKADKVKPDALVIECMAVQPLLQSLCELKLVRSTHGVLCNAREDHLDVMGPTEKDVALALAGTMPIKGKFITPEKKYLPIFEMAAKDRGTEVVTVDAEHIEDITDEEMAQFSYLEYKENVALALMVCQSCGVERQDALQGMWEATPDPGALIVKTIEYAGKQITFANGFAANDPLSTSQLWVKVIEHVKDVDEVVGLVNCRDDRGDRSRQMAEAIVNWDNNEHLLAIGSGTEIFIKSLPTHKQLNIANGQGWKVKEILDYLTKAEGVNHVLAIGVCNIAKIGFELLNYFCSQPAINTLADATKEQE